MIKSREIWIDNVKVLACILVAIGHFLQSMLEAGLMKESMVSQWFVDTIYYFHVPLFFLCSGFLYQRHTRVDSFQAWRAHIIRKAVTLGVPYFVFSFITWLLKAVFSGSVNTQNKGLTASLFIYPASPYWYLYVLFFVFAVIPTFKNKKWAIFGLLTTFMLKILVCTYGMQINAYIVSQIMKNGIWFVLGMCMCIWDIPAICHRNEMKKYGVICVAVFLAASAAVSIQKAQTNILSFAMGILGCAATVLLLLNSEQNIFPKILITNTMPVFLMHTIFAAGLRIILIKLGVYSLGVHMVCGLSISFLGPIVAAKVMERIKLDFLIYPGKYMKV